MEDHQIGATETEIDRESFDFDVFLSYSTDPDFKLSRKLEAFLEDFHRLPSPKDINLKELRVCRDGSNFSLQRDAESLRSGEKTIVDYLSRSRYLLVLCSQNSKNSFWMDKELAWFLEHRPNYILIAVTEGVDPSSNESEVFSERLIKSGLHQKLFWYDFREESQNNSVIIKKTRNFDDECTRLAADLLNASADDIRPIWYKERLRRTKELEANLAQAFREKAERLANDREDLTASVLFAKSLTLRDLPETRHLLSRTGNPIFEWAWTWRNFNPNVQSGSNSRITSLNYIPDEEIFIATSADGAISFIHRDGVTKKVEFTESPIQCAIVSLEHLRFVTAHLDKKIRVWSLKELRCLFEKEVSGIPLGIDVAPSQNFMALGMEGDGITFFTFPDLEEYDSVSFHGTSIQGIAFDPVRSLAYWAGGGEYVWIHDLIEKKPARGMPKRGWTNSLACSSDGKYLSIGGADRIVGLIDLELNRTFRAGEHEGEITVISFSPNAQILATADEKGWIKIWSMTEGQQLAMLPQHPDRVRSICITDDGLVIIGTDEGCVRAWQYLNESDKRLIAPSASIKKAFVEFENNMGQPHPLNVKTGRYDSRVSLLSFSADDTLSALMSDGVLARWKSGLLFNEPVSLCTSPFGQAIASQKERIAVLCGIPEQTLTVIDIDNNENPVFEVFIAGSNMSFRQVAISADGEYVAAVQPNNSICLWSVSEKTLLHTFCFDHDLALTAIAFNPDANIFAVGINDCTIELYNLDRYEFVISKSLKSGYIHTINFSSHEHVIIGFGTSVTLLEMPDLKQVWTVEAPTNIIAEDSGSQLVASGGAGGEVHILDINDGKLVKLIQSTTEPIQSLCFDRQGKYLAFGDCRETVYIHNLDFLKRALSLDPLELLSETLTKSGIIIDGFSASLASPLNLSENPLTMASRKKSDKKLRQA